MRIIFISLVIIVSCDAVAQNVERAGWLFSSHEQTLTKKLKLFSDVQVRSANDFSFVETILIRPGLTFEIKKDKDVTVGYTYFGSWESSDDGKEFVLEQRVWEQYSTQMNFTRLTLTGRLRLEQRFLPTDKFAQRLRLYFKSELPFSGQVKFQTGPFVAIQNEIFLNIQNKDNVNNKLYDQNRSYVGIGYRFSEHLDVEFGYLLRHQIETEGTLRTHIAQLSIFTQW